MHVCTSVLVIPLALLDVPMKNPLLSLSLIFCQSKLP